MKIIDLLNKTANGDIPKKIKYKDLEYRACGNGISGFTDYVNDDDRYCFSAYIGVKTLNDEVEILEETPKVQVEMTEKEYFKYLDEQHKYMEQVKNYKPKPSYLKIDEQKKIPEKIEIYEDEEGHYFIDNHCKKIYITCDEINFIVEEFNEIIDYLKSKGE